MVAHNFHIMHVVFVLMVYICSKTIGCYFGKMCLINQWIKKGVWISHTQKLAFTSHAWEFIEHQLSIFVLFQNFPLWEIKETKWFSMHTKAKVRI